MGYLWFLMRDRAAIRPGTAMMPGLTIVTLPFRAPFLWVKLRPPARMT